MTGQNSDVLIRIEDAKKDNEIYRLLKPWFRSNSEISDKRQCIVESIFGELKVDEEIIFSDDYSSCDESDESLSKGNKSSKSFLQLRIAGISESECTRKWRLSIFIIRYACIWWILCLICSTKISRWSN